MKTLYNTVQQCESILDPNQDQVMSRMTDDMIRQRIREYCTYDSRKYYRDELWSAADYDLKIDRIDKDDKGWYVDTSADIDLYPPAILYESHEKSYYDSCISWGQPIDRQKGFLIEDLGVYFRWRKHRGGLAIEELPYFESTEGLPEELDCLYIKWSCEKSKKLTVHNKIDIIWLNDMPDINIYGKGCKNVIISPYNQITPTVPRGVKVHRPEEPDDLWNLRRKLIGY